MPGADCSSDCIAAGRRNRLGARARCGRACAGDAGPQGRRGESDGKRGCHVETSGCVPCAPEDCQPSGFRQGCYPPTDSEKRPRSAQGKSAGSGPGHQERRSAGFSAGFPGLDGIPREAASTHPRSLRLGIDLQRERRTRRGEARHRSFGTGIITRFRAPGRRVTRRTLPSGPEP